MRKLCEIKREIELARNELDEAVLQGDGIELYYEKSTRLDMLIEEYLERKECGTASGHIGGRALCVRRAHVLTGECPDPARQWEGYSRTPRALS